VASKIKKIHTKLCSHKTATETYNPKIEQFNMSPHPRPIPTNMAQHTTMGKKNTFPIPTATGKQPKLKNQTRPQLKHGMGKHPHTHPHKERKIRKTRSPVVVAVAAAILIQTTVATTTSKTNQPCFLSAAKDRALELRYSSTASKSTKTTTPQ
jgi:hypothetical protein